MGASELKPEMLQAPQMLKVMMQLSYLAQSAASMTPALAANKLLEQVRSFCSAQRGVLLLNPQSRAFEGETTVHPGSARILALYHIEDEEAWKLLDSVSLNGEIVQVNRLETCWLAYWLPLEWAVDNNNPDMTDSDVAQSDSVVSQSLYSQQALLLLGWTDLAASQYTSIRELATTGLVCVADAVKSVIVSVLLAERLRELEISVVREMERLKSDLIGTVSHELRSPLTAIKGYAATLLRQERRLSREERREFLNAIGESSDHLETIIERLLEMADFEAGIVRLHVIPVDIVRLALEAITAAEERLAGHKRGEFTFILSVQDAQGVTAEAVPLVRGDPRRLREVLDNLLENAVNYSPQGGPVEVVVRSLWQKEVSGATGLSPRTQELFQRDQGAQQLSRPMVEVVVRDRGMGIPAEHLNSIFDRFHRVDTRLTREVNGLGLGLAFCKRIIDLHDGIIWARSNPGAGSAFYTWLPAADASDDTFH